MHGAQQPTSLCLGEDYIIVTSLHLGDGYIIMTALCLGEGYIIMTSLPQDRITSLQHCCAHPAHLITATLSSP